MARTPRAGFRGGLATGLFTPGERHVGFLSLLTEDPTRPGDADRQLIARSRGVVATYAIRTELRIAAPLSTCPPGSGVTG